MAKPESKRLAELRRRAESNLRRAVKKTLPNLTSQDSEALIHELRVHEIELELQCQDLQSAQVELEASRNRYQALYESIPLGYVTIDSEGRICDLNPAGVDLLGEKPSASLKNLNFFMAPPDLDRFTLFCRRVIATQEPGTDEFRMKRADGGVFFAWIQAVPVGMGKDRGKHLRIAFKNITERKKAEELLRRRQDDLLAAREAAETSLTSALARESKTSSELLVSSLRLDSIVQSAMDAIITVGDDQRILLFNQAAEAMFRLPADQAIGQPIDRFIPSRYREAHRQHVHDFGRSGVTSRKMGRLGTVTGYRADGTEFPVEASISQITAENKAFYTVILRDIAEREHAERLLRQSEERYRQLVAVSPYAIVVLRGERVLLANEQGIKLLGGVTTDDVLKKSLFDLFHPDDRLDFRQQIQGLFEGRTAIPMAERKLVGLDGTMVDIEVSAARFEDDEGPAVLVVLHDISERKRLQAQLRRTERVAELGTLASGMAHEIGTPMNVILGRAEYLMDRVQEEPIKKGLQTIITQVERITKVMSQLLSFARRKPLQVGPVNFRQIIENSLEMFQQRLSHQGIHLETHIETDCPPVQADSDQMSQVLINLIMNAIHAMPNGGRLRIGLYQDGSRVKCTVADTGHGMREEVVKKIFEPFFTTKEFGKGTGLGLTVVKGIIEEHHGSIAVESEEGKRTTFTILLPAGV